MKQNIAPTADNKSDAEKEIDEMFAELERKERHLAAFREVMKL